jgi:hypothetical protein
MMAIRRPSPRAALTLLFVVLGVAWGGFLGVRHLAALGSGLDRLEDLSLDWRYSVTGPRSPPPGVVIAAIDEDTIPAGGDISAAPQRPGTATRAEPARPGGNDFIPAPSRVLWPQDIFRQATQSGLSNVSTDRE